MTQIVLPAGIAAASDIIPVVPAAKECDCPDGIHFANVIHYVVPNSCLQSQPDTPDDGPWYVVTKGKVVGIFNNLAICQHAVTKVAGNSSRRFATLDTALTYFNNNLTLGIVGVVQA
ncbi:hypothetical protein PILCRDRAFT_12350 [Piloderma croceum F 1598]|uniref:Ribonuclease H1 N-terminal domain-containing protein n=1 Tax=Piloderma croceum (strain F 1598) TaxID=765440 RepID=A0A0C3EU95_PILCF|nr:hypothetical protein PILCRDRAFT_16922 [Piloderma croceum F 1598]KIM76986.1 hypothetical protein PILCRDRAFT_12350 [Piloderma croceum F 1598]